MAENARHGTSAEAPPISVVICTYRREESLRLLLLDLVSQEDIVFEIIVVDQTASHEPETDALFARYSERIRHLHIAEPNLPNARNEGIAVARGEVVVFIDDDLRIPSDFLRDLAAHFEDPAIEGLAPLVVVAGEEPAGAYTQQLYRFRGDWRSRERIRVRHIIGACMAYRLRLVRNLGGFDALMGRLNPSAAAEDGEFCGRWLRAGHQLWLAPAVRAVHVGNLPGGCEMRQMPGSEATRQQQRSLAFVVLKEERSFERMSLRAWLRILRVTVLRRDVLQQRPSVWLRAYRGMRRTVNDVREFWRQHGGSPAAARVDLRPT